MFEKPVVKTFQYGNHTVTLETGVIARQATAAVMVTMDDTAVFVSVVGKKEAVEGQDFFPLTVNYQERTYAAGKIPGGFFKREGRPSEGETLTARLIDRPIRPLFPDAFKNEVQVIATVVSVNPDVQPDIVTMIGTSAALAISGIPFNGPIGAARVGHIDGQLVLNPSNTELEASKLDLVVAGTESAVLMVESEADNLTEEEMLSAVVYGHDQQQTVIKAINEFAAEVATPAWDWVAPEENTALVNKIAELAEAKLVEAYQITEKMARYDRIHEIAGEVNEVLLAEDPEANTKEIHTIFHDLEKTVVRRSIIAGNPRIDGREKDMVRAMLSESLKAVISQTLLKKQGGGRVAAHEIMIGTPAIRNLIRENKIAQMYSAIQTGQQFGMQTLDQNLQQLVQKNVVTRQEALSKAANKDAF